MLKPNLLIIDNAEKTWVGWVWKVGAVVFRGKFDHVIRANSVSEACAAISSKAWGEIHIWGHGAPGTPLVAGEPIPAKIFHRHCRRVWFRSCEVFRGVTGQAFAQQLADVGIDAAAHLEIVHVWQGGLVGIRAGSKVWWSADTPAGYWSKMWGPRTVFALRQEIPDWAWSE